MYGKNWNLVHKYVGSRSSAQTRSHAQKYFNKLIRYQETGEGGGLTEEAKEHLLLIGYGQGNMNTSPRNQFIIEKTKTGLTSTS
jgi:hypothetical protein